jgi:hypothetical protein
VVEPVRLRLRRLRIDVADLAFAVAGIAARIGPGGPILEGADEPCARAPESVAIAKAAERRILVFIMGAV